jgi:hypothetical protein
MKGSALAFTGPDVVVQVHIPKCAGTAVADWLRRTALAGVSSGFGSFYPDYIFTADTLWTAGIGDARMTTVSAHNIRTFPATIHGRRIRYFTLLREPLAQALSGLRYLMQEGVIASGTTAAEGATWLLDRPMGFDYRDNTQTNHLALYTWCAQTPRADPALIAQWPADLHAAYLRERLDVAKDVLRTFFVTGTVERLRESMTLMRDRALTFGVRLLPVDEIELLNVTTVDPREDMRWLDGPLGDRFRASVAVDAQLYAFGKTLLDEALRDEDLAGAG